MTWFEWFQAIGPVFKDFAPFLGVLVVAFTSGVIAWMIESHKFNFKTLEIRHTVAYKQKFEALEEVSAAMGEVTSKFANVVAVVDMSEVKHVVEIQGDREVEKNIDLALGRLNEAFVKFKELKNKKLLHLTPPILKTLDEYDAGIVAGLKFDLPDVKVIVSKEEKRRVIRDGYSKELFHKLQILQDHALTAIRAEKNTVLK